MANSLFQINTEIKGSVKLREKTLAIGHQFAKFANVFSSANVFRYMVPYIGVLTISSQTPVLPTQQTIISIPDQAAGKDLRGLRAFCDAKNECIA